MFYILIVAYIITVIFLLRMKEWLSVKTLFIFWITVLLFVVLPSTCDNIKIVKSKKIYSLYNDNELNGYFVLGSGSIEQKEYYYYFTKDDGAYYKEKISSNVGIIETEKTPRIETIIMRPNIWYGEAVETIIRQKIYVPKGTIIKEFKVR